jgi:phospholipid/cholesterol/gamma-HCH transport system ATP-binding protein
MADPSSAIISFEGVSKAFGETVIFRGLDLVIEKGLTTAIIGPSGVGKSVLLKLLVGLLQPDAGRVMVFGTDIAAAGHDALYAVRRRMGMLFQDGALFDALNVGENVAFPLVHHRKDMSEAERRDRVEQVLEQVGLPGLAGRETAALSGGQRKRVGLARAIVHAPEVVLFDEPNSGLDPITSDAIDALIGEMKEALGITFLIISHDIVGTLNVADRIGMLYGGDLVAYAPTEAFLRSDVEIVQRFLKRNVVLPTAEAPKARLPTLADLRGSNT